MSHAGKSIVVTGGANSIGRATALRLSRGGARVVIADIDEEAGLSAVHEIRAAGREALFVHCDVGERLDVHNLVAATLDGYGRIDALVNNASVALPSAFLDLDEATFDRALRVNLKGAFLTGQAAAKQMVRQSEQARAAGEAEAARYSIVHISSINAVIAAPDLLPLAVSKGGLNQLTKAMAVALAPHGIRVNAVGPGSVRSSPEDDGAARADLQASILARTPLGRIAEPDEIAAIAAFLVSDEASYVTGQCLYVDGGRLALNFMMPSS